MKENNKPNEENEIGSLLSNASSLKSEPFDFFLKEKQSVNPLIKNDKKGRNPLEIKEDKNEEEKEEENNINLEELKLGKKIICPEENCFSNAIISIDPVSFKVKSDCGKHKRKLNIIFFAKKSGLSKIEKECCSICNTTIKELEEKEVILYKCYCGENLCEKCKEEHLKEKNVNKHNMIDFAQKDYICCCDKSLNKFIIFCLDCKKNICVNCKVHHSKHNIKNFSDIYKLSKEEKSELKKILIEQKKNVKKVNKILDDWLIRTKKLIDNYKKKLELYEKLNNIILNAYRSNNKYYEEIKNIENIRYDFDQHFQDLLKFESDPIKQNNIIFRLLNEKDINPNKSNQTEKIELENIISHKLEGKVKKICEIKKENLLVVNIIKNEFKTDQLNIYKKSENNNYDQLHMIQTIDGGTIQNISELKSGKLLIVQKKCFKIASVTKTKTKFDIIQNQSDIDNFIQIKELNNGFLVSMSFIPNAQNNIILWENNLMSNLYEKIEVSHPIQIPETMLEINNNSFLVYFKDSIISLYDSNTNKEKGKMIKINNTYGIKNMIKINEDNVLLLYPNGAIIYNYALIEISNFYTFEFKILDLCQIPNSNNIFLTSIYRQNDYDLIHLILDFFNQKINLGESIKNNHEGAITCTNILNNGDLVTGSLDNSIKIWKIKIK